MPKKAGKKKNKFDFLDNDEPETDGITDASKVLLFL